MAIGKYFVFGTLTPLDIDERGVGQTFTSDAHIYVKKPNGHPPPYDVANEYVCGELARMIRLPVPPGFIGLLPDGSHTYCSLGFNLKGEKAPPIIPGRAAVSEPDLCTGVIIFDIWIANTDRHHKNISYKAQRAPHRLQAIDHGHALFGFWKPGELVDDLAIVGGPGRNRHCLLDWLPTADYVSKWVARIQALPAEIIREVVMDSVSLGVPRHLAEQGVQFLLGRRMKLPELIRSNKSEFTSVSDWGLEWAS